MAWAGREPPVRGDRRGRPSSAAVNAFFSAIEEILVFYRDPAISHTVLDV